MFKGRSSYVPLMKQGNNILFHPAKKINVLTKRPSRFKRDGLNQSSGILYCFTILCIDLLLSIFISTRRKNPLHSKSMNGITFLTNYITILQVKTLNFIDRPAYWGSFLFIRSLIIVSFVCNFYIDDSLYSYVPVNQKSYLKTGIELEIVILTP